MSRYKNLIITILAFVLPILSFGQQEGSTLSFLEQNLVEIVLGLAVLVCLVAIVAMFTTVFALKVILRDKKGEVPVEELTLIPTREGEEHLGFWAKFWDRFNAATPIAQEAKVATDHEYDGIRELDNRLPPWWIYGFYFTIIFGVGYIINYHVLKSNPLQHEEFQAEMIKAEEDVQLYLASLDNLIDESNVELLTETTELAAGQAIYEKNCAVCHLADGGGSVGPNFTDQYWIHGGDIKDIYKTIKYGVPSKGMISWETQLSPKDMQRVASFIYTLEGTTPAKAKDPQGELYKRTGPSETEQVSDSTSAETVEVAMN